MRFLFAILFLGSVVMADSIPLGEYLSRARSGGRLEAFIGQWRAEAARRLPAELLRPLEEQLSRFERGNFSGWERFPTLPQPRELAPWIEGGRLLVGALPERLPAPPAGAMTGSLVEKLRRPCRAEYASLPPLSPHLPGILYGHFPNKGIEPCLFQDSGIVAELLNALVASNGSSVEYSGTRHSSVESLAEALLRSGHRITVRDERMFADFLSLGFVENERETYIRIPVWLDTGLRLRNGKPVRMPVVHSHHAWSISGPHVNAEVMFYLGISGVGFYPNRSRRPSWTGQVNRMTRTANGWDANGPYIAATFSGAAAYHRQIVQEASTVAKGLPAQGYGYVGVCNDSNAFMAQWTHSLFPMRARDFSFPLVRHPGLDASPVSDVERVLAAVPHDTRRDELEPDLARRVLGSYPHPLSGNGFDAELRADMRALAAEISKGKR